MKLLSGFLTLGIRVTWAVSDCSGKINTFPFKSVEEGKKTVTKNLSVLLFDLLSLQIVDCFLIEYIQHLQGAYQCIIYISRMC